MSSRSLLLWVVPCLFSCGADIEPYQPTLVGIDNEHIDPSGPPRDVSFVDGNFVEPAEDEDCSAPAVFERFYVVVDNQYRNRTVQVRHVAEDCSEREGETVTPGEESRVAVYVDEVIRIVDASDDTVIHSWRVTGLDALEDARIVLRSTDPEI